MQKEESARSSQRRDTEIRHLIQLYESGLSMAEVGLQFGISRQRVEQILKKAGVKTRKYTKSDKFLEVRKEKRKILPKELLLKFYQDKTLSISEVIEKLKTNVTLLYKSLEFHNIPKRIDESLKHTRLTEDVLRRLYLKEYLTSAEIASQLGYSPITIRNKLSKLGIRKRDR